MARVRAIWHERPVVGVRPRGHTGSKTVTGIIGLKPDTALAIAMQAEARRSDHAGRLMQVTRMMRTRLGESSLIRRWQPSSPFI
ncbi:MAG: hypothetical protein ACLPXB_08845 [Thiobacillaceae bacterium]